MAFDPKTAFTTDITKMFADMKMPTDITKMFADMKMPSMPGMSALMAAHQRNIEALTAANKVAMEGAQTFARRQAEIVQQSVSELTEAMKSFAGVEAPQEKVAKQADLLKQTYERGVANLRELGDLISRSNGEAVELLNRRFADAMEEVKTLTSKK